MADLAAHLVDDVLPEVPIRQWVCSLPWTMRCMLAFDRALCADVLAAFISALTRSLKRRAKRHLSLRSVDDALVGALTVIQRSDSALRVNPHFHTLALDGVYVRAAEGELVFHPLPAPSADDVAQVAAWTHAGIVRVLERHGRSLEGADDTPHEGASEQPVLAACYAASASDVQLLGAALHPLREREPATLRGLLALLAAYRLRRLRRLLRLLRAHRYLSRRLSPARGTRAPRQLMLTLADFPGRIAAGREGSRQLSGLLAHARVAIGAGVRRRLFLLAPPAAARRRVGRIVGELAGARGDHDAGDEDS